MYKGSKQFKVALNSMWRWACHAATKVASILGVIFETKNLHLIMLAYTNKINGVTEPVFDI